MRLNLIVIRTENIDALAKFYEKLGIEFLYHRHEKGPFHYSTELDGTVFEIYPLLKSQLTPDSSLRLGFEVEHLNNLIIKLEKQGMEIVNKPIKSEWGYFAIIKDLDGRKIELKEV